MLSLIAALKQHQLFKYSPKRAVVNIVGPEAKDFLQRMGTNDMAMLAPCSALQTCLLNNKGRIHDCVIVCERDKESYALISSFADGQRLIDWLEQFHFVEELSMNLSKESCEFIVSSHDMQETFDDHYVFWRSFDIDFYVAFGSGDFPILEHKAWEMVRIHALMPSNNEIAMALMPQNIGLSALISHNKGCYLGQEVVAKAITYQKHPKSLGGAKLSLETFQKVKLNDYIEDQQGHMGIITSIAPDYVAGWVNALAIVQDKDNKIRSNDFAAEFIFAKK